MTIQQAFELGLQHHQAGRLAEAEALYRQILAVQPNHADALHLLGVIAQQVGRHELAADLIRQAIALHPDNPTAHSNLGGVCCALGRPEEGIVSFRRAIELKPDFADAYNNLGNALRELGQAGAAVSAIRRAIELNGHLAEAHNNLGIALMDLGYSQEAIAEYRRALEIKPAYVEAYSNLGNALKDQGLFEEAVAAFRHALDLRPAYADAHNNLGNLFKEQGRIAEALAEYHAALQINPAFPEAHNNRGAVFEDQGRFDEAIAEYRRALDLKPDYADAHNNLGNSLRGQGQLDEAAAAYRQALALQSNHPKAGSNLATVLRDQGRLDEAIGAYRRVLESMPNQNWLHSNLIFALHSHPRCNESEIAEEQQRWSRQFGEPVKAFARPHRNDRDPERQLRIGYVSPDFRLHAVGLNLLPLFQNHAHQHFEIVCYSGVVNSDQITSELQKSAAHWRSTVGVSDEALAEIIRQDGVDILVDLSQHSGGNRLPIFARQPAPVQVSFAGYPDSTGLEAIAYRLSDRWLEAEDARSSAFTRRPLEGGTPSRQSDVRVEHVFLIDSFWCYDPCGVEVEVNELPVKKSGHVTFGSLNTFSKVNDPLLKLWLRVLRAVPDSHLVLLSGFGSHRQRTVEFLAREGIAANRVEFVGRSSREEYLKTYHRLDMVLDTFPYNGHTTSLDALWMGVPVVSLAGGTRVSRGGLSVLSNLGLPELVAHSEDEYVAISTALACDLPHLAELRRTLRARMETSVLMDAPRFARNIEAAYRAMWRRWCAEKADA